MDGRTTLLIFFCSSLLLPIAAQTTNNDASCVNDNDDGDSGVGRGIGIGFAIILCIVAAVVAALVAVLWRRGWVLPAFLPCQAADHSGKSSDRDDTHGTVTALTTAQSHSRQNTGNIQSSQRSGEEIVPATPTNPGNYSNLDEDLANWTTSSDTPFSKRVHLSEGDKDRVKTRRTVPPRSAQAEHPGVSDVYEIVEESATKIKRGASGIDSDVYEDPDKPARAREVMRLPERVPPKGKKMPCERDDDVGAMYQNTPPQRRRSDVGYSNTNHAYSNDDDRNSAAPNGETDDVYIEVTDGRPITDSMYMNRD